MESKRNTIGGRCEFNCLQQPLWSFYVEVLMILSQLQTQLIQYCSSFLVTKTVRESLKNDVL